ncbi:hypothetical protein [Maritimibacter fusiformis]|uniref:Cold shock domain-containing protein n=1 Tax=Maritimibacter fusiformis TaxID=2603819 RepID=A0A5D0RSH8_9RHOB|nr:hypothetical protein [Maritimibacter fusiformis]TYB83501.1 hypothetical protein FVF75_00290 [Maritimibacter fusiformis]
MIGLVLWHNPEVGVGVIWCEDQGPLAFLGPEVALPEGIVAMHPGDEIKLLVQIRDGVRYVCEITSLRAGKPGTDPRAILAGAAAQVSATPPDLKIVA